MMMRRREQMYERFFRATAAYGHLHLSDVATDGPWTPEQIVYYDMKDIDAIRSRTIRVSVVRSAEELDEMLRISRNMLATVNLYVLERLLEPARERWVAMRQDLAS
jgi:hypothetical protein